MATSFKAAHTAAATLQISQPSIFDILAQHSQSQSLKPALKYLLKFLSMWFRNRRLSTILQWFDELYCICLLVVENHFLKKYGASFSENFYSMKRIFVNSSNRLRRLKSLFFLAILPYIEGKLNDFRDKIENIEPHMRSPFMNFFYKWYPIACKLLGLIGLIVLVLYGFGYANVQTLPLLLIGARLDRLSADELKEMESAPLPHMHSGALGRVSRLFLQIPSWTGRLFSYALFFKDVHEFMQQNVDAENNRNFTFENEFAKPVHPLKTLSEPEVLAMDTGKCPLCFRNRENDTVLSCSGYIFCFTCINNFVRREKRCPVTAIPATPDELVRLYRKSG